MEQFMIYLGDSDENLVQLRLAYINLLKSEIFRIKYGSEENLSREDVILYYNTLFATKHKLNKKVDNLNE